MDTENHFTTRKPLNQFLSTIVDYYFYIDISVNQLSVQQEFIIPFPRITFGYFFNHPFTVVNHTLKQSTSVNMAISRISTDRITVEPQTERIRIIGAHMRPFCLAYLTSQPVNQMPWLIDTVDLFGKTAIRFQHIIDQCLAPEQMFEAVEKIFIDNILVRNLSLITDAVDLIEKSAGTIQMTELSEQLGVSDRTIRNHFNNEVGCNPKEYIRLVKLRQVAYQLKNSKESLTSIAHDNEYFDQAHFIREIKTVTGKSPKELRKEIPGFRFLQF